MAATGRLFNGPFISSPTTGEPIGVLGADGREYLLPALTFNATAATAQPASYNPGAVAITGGTMSGVTVTGGTLNGIATAQYPYVLARDHRSRIIPSSGSSNASGAITLTTALPYTPPAAAPVFIYLPAGVVTAGSQGTGANFYQVTFSSTTACQITGTGIVTANAAFTQSTSIIPIATVTVPANALGLNGSLMTTMRWSFLNNANAKNTRLMFGGQAVSQNTNANTLTFLDQQWVSNRGAANAQVAGWNGFQAVYGPQGTAIFNTTMNVDTTAAQNLVIDAALAVATDYVISEGYTVLLVP